MMERFQLLMTRYSVEHPWRVTLAMIAVLVVPLIVVLLGTFAPGTFPMLSPVTIDTDPENMLSHEEPVRVRHDRMKKVFDIPDIVVVGIVEEDHPNGVFNMATLGRIHELSQFALTLRWPDPDDPAREEGVIGADMVSPSTVDQIEQGGLGSVSFTWLMPRPPASDAEAREVLEKARRLPYLNGTLLSEDGKAISLYLPLTSKDMSYQVRERLLEKIESWGETNEDYHITGLPVAEDTFGVEMFIQMGLSAPLAMVVITFMLWVFFRKWQLILSPIIVAVVSATTTMALLVATGNTIHIMSSMIPIFIMPIAVLDAIHILSEFFDRYQETRDRRRTVLTVMKALFTPMFFTTLTTSAGFLSLALTPIPPVQVFGIFVGVGVFLAWLWTITFIPAFIMFIPESSLRDFGHQAGHEDEEATLLSRVLIYIGRMMHTRARTVLVLFMGVIVVSVYGISKITINDNPIKWFTSSHPIRVADRVLNEHFGGTYMAYLVLDSGEEAVGHGADSLETYLPGYRARLKETAGALEDDGFTGIAPVMTAFNEQAEAIIRDPRGAKAFIAALLEFVEERQENAPEDSLEIWEEMSLFLDQERQRGELFKDPETLAYLERLQRHLDTQPTVGKTNSLIDLVKTVHRELFLGEEAAYRIPDSRGAVAQSLLTYQNSHRPQDLWHFVTPDYRNANMWVQLTSGDNRDMAKVDEALQAFLAENPPPHGLRAQWFGLTFINMVWQERMVNGMLQSFLGSFLVVLLMMILLFRSFLWGLLSMIPLTLAVGFIYGLIGFIGKDYDMPVAVLSALSLGLAVDYAIHFIARSREAMTHSADWHEALATVFGEPARAISRNVIVLGVGFLPLLVAPLVPYKTVGVFIAAILLAAGVVTLLVLPALITLLESRLFRSDSLAPCTGDVTPSGEEGIRTQTVLGAAVVFAALIAVNIHQFAHMSWITGTAIAVAVAAAAFALFVSARWIRSGLKPTHISHGASQ